MTGPGDLRGTSKALAFSCFGYASAWCLEFLSIPATLKRTVPQLGGGV